MKVSINLEAIEEASRIIVRGDQKPTWLDPRLREKARSIKVMREAEARAPSRKKTKPRLLKFAKAASSAADALQDGLDDIQFCAFLGHDWRAPGSGHTEIIGFLRDLAERASRARSSLLGQGGDGIAYPSGSDDSLSAQQYCAWTAKHAIRLVRKVTEVGIGLPDAWTVANLLWVSAGGEALGSEDNDPSGWRDHLIAVATAEKAEDARAAWLRSMLVVFDAEVLVQLD